MSTSSDDSVNLTPDIRKSNESIRITEAVHPTQHARMQSKVSSIRPSSVSMASGQHKLSDICAGCSHPVYSLTKVKIDDKTFHKGVDLVLSNGNFSLFCMLLLS